MESCLDQAAMQVEHLAAKAFGAEASSSAVSGSAAVLAAASCLAAPGRAALVPGWICSGVVHALVLAGTEPVMVDIRADFTASTDHATVLLASHDVALAIYAPYGGSPLGIDDWARWSRLTGVPLLVDLAQTPDPLMWTSASQIGAATVTSFRAGKPLGATGGGLVAGPGEIVERIRLFLSGGRDRNGRKVSLGLELPMHPADARAALRVLDAHHERVPAWRASSRRALARLGPSLLPGWDVMTHIAVSRIPTIGVEGIPLHPDRTYRLAAVRQRVARGSGPAAQSGLPRLDALYDRIRVVKVTSPPGADWPGGAPGRLGELS